jgi:superfamily II DNA helicase RecQ
MQLKFFTIPVHDNGASEREMNVFLKSQKVLEVIPSFNASANGASWNVCVKYIETAPPFNKSGSVKVDYRETLQPEVFALFSKLRVIRKQISTDDGVPAYAVFTDEELAGISGLPELNTALVKKVTGVGEKKLEKYGERMVEMYNHSHNDQKGK